MRTRLVPALVATTLLLAACGSDDSSGDSDPPADATGEAADEPADGATDESSNDDGSTDDTASDDGSADDPADDAADSEDSEPASDSDAESDGDGGGGSGNATLTLASGETYEFSVLCSLEPQMAAGSEILFTAVSYDDPSLDITQFGDEGTVTGTASVSVYDGETYDSLWGASSSYEAFGGSLELTLEGSTIRGVGTFFEADDPTVSPEGVEGEVVANC